MRTARPVSYTHLDVYKRQVYPEGKSGMADLGWAAASMAYWPNVMLCKTWYYEPEDIYDQMLEKNKTCDKSLALGFTFDSTKVADQMTACANAVSYTHLNSRKPRNLLHFRSSVPFWDS